MAKIETTFIRPKELYTPETGETKVVYDGYQNNPHELVVEENLEGEVSEIVNDTFVPNEGGNVVFTDNNETEHELITEDGFAGALDTAMPTALAKAQVIETTWQELKDKRDNGQLIAGSLYRITDYNCTTTQENTQSAGHQFDIVLLALSENKLAEEGWAMMNESNIYDVTFSDGVTKKCWIYCYATDDDISFYNVVLVDTLLGLSSVESGDIIINEENKTAIFDGSYSDLSNEGLMYNYFQNSNLSAWKVWYCLDNDTSRFAWADDKIRLKINVNGDVYITTGRASVSDRGEYLDWGYQSEDVTTAVYTKGTPKIGDPVYYWTGNPSSPIWVTLGIVEEIEITNGRGVIYRLIDEFNNDCPYDFKNVLYLRKVTDGEIDAQGTDTYIPTFCLYDIGNDEYRDASVFAIEYPDDEGKARPCNNIFISNILAIDHSIDSGIYALPQNIILEMVEEDDTGWGSRDVMLVAVFMCNFIDNMSHVICLSSSNKTYSGYDNAIINQNKRVVWEDIP